MTVATVTNRHDGSYCTNRVRRRAHTREVYWAQREPSRRFVTVRCGRGRLWPLIRCLHAKIGEIRPLRKRLPFPAEPVLFVRI